MRRISLRLAALAASTLLALAALGPAVPAEEARVIEIVARRFQFTPNQVTLRKDEPVVFRLRSEDVIHGFYLKPLGIDALIEPGKTTDVAVTPHERGTFSIICDHYCGSGHGGMKLKVQVE